MYIIIVLCVRRVHQAFTSILAECMLGFRGSEQSLFDQREVQVLKLLNGKEEQVALRFNQLVSLEHFVVEYDRARVVAKAGNLEHFHQLRQL